MNDDQHKITLYGIGLMPDPKIEAPYAYMVNGKTAVINPVVWNGLVQALRDSGKASTDDANKLFYYEQGQAIIGQYSESHDDFIKKLCFEIVAATKAGLEQVPMTMGAGMRSVAIAKDIVSLLNQQVQDLEFDEHEANISAIILRAIAQS